LLQENSCTNHGDLTMTKAEQVPQIGGGMPVIQYWAKHTLSPTGLKLWQTLNHHSACLSCAWGTGGQKGGFVNEDGEILQRCAKSVEAIASELQPAIPATLFNQRSIATLQTLNSQAANNLGRLSHPLIKRAGSDYYEQIDWSEVYEITTTAFQTDPHRIASYSSGRSSNEAAFLLQLFMRALGSNHLADCSDLCHSASTLALKQVFGSGTSMVSLDEFKHADCVVLIGSNAPANHPRLMNDLIKLRDRGGKVIVINPTKEVGLVKFASPAFPLTSLLHGSEISSLYLQPIPGSDVALFVGIQKALIDRELIDLPYLQNHTDNWQAIVTQAQNTPWEIITSTCGVTQAEIEIAAEMIGATQAVVFAWAMGITQHLNGIDNVLSIANTALLTGNAGKPGAGTMPIRGHSNVQGFGSMGVTVHLKQQIQTALERLLQRPLSRTPGYDTRALMEAADREEIDTLLCLGGNLYAANPDLGQGKRALGKIKTIIYVATKPNIGHFHGLAAENTLVLPVFTRFENPHVTTVESGNNYVRFNDPGTTHLQNAALIPEVELLADLAAMVLGDLPINWHKLQDPIYVRELIAQTIPGYQQVGNNTKQEFTIPGRIFTTPEFPTANGKAQMVVTPLPELKLPSLSDFGLAEHPQAIVVALGTGRSYSQHNTVVYQAGDKYRGMPHRNCILMNEADATSVGWRSHQLVTVRGDVGQIENVEIIFGQVRRGAAMMFYPEVNVIFSAQIDHGAQATGEESSLSKRSGTPAFKRVPVAIYSQH
jgi:molybdopterin-dependent oxidoreductase alpha subunit